MLFSLKSCLSRRQPRPGPAPAAGGRAVSWPLDTFYWQKHHNLDTLEVQVQSPEREHCCSVEDFKGLERSRVSSCSSGPGTQLGLLMHYKALAIPRSPNMPRINACGCYVAMRGTSLRSVGSAGFGARSNRLLVQKYKYQ